MSGFKRKRIYAPRSGYRKFARVRRHYFSKASRSKRRVGRGFQMRNSRYGKFKGLGQPKQLRINLMFEETWSDTTAAPGYVQYFWKGNSLYDPDVALGGELASGAQMWAYIYKKYKVLSSAIQVTVVNRDTDDPVRVVTFPSERSDVIGLANINGLSGLPGSRNGIANQQTGSCQISNFARTADVLGLKFLDDPGLSAQLITADPAHPWYWQTIFWNNAQNALNCEVTVRIIYHCLLSEPFFFGLSDTVA